MRLEQQLPLAMDYFRSGQDRIEPQHSFAEGDIGLGCAVGFHLGINNSTGKCIACGAQLEKASESGFAKAAYFGDTI